MSHTMPALSIRQPWAWLIVHGFKDVENRDWHTPFRGRFLVHAGKTLARAYYDEQVSAMAQRRILPAGFPSFDELRTQCGGIVGEARLQLVADQSQSPWYIPGSYAWRVTDAKPMPFWPMRGKLGFFNVAVAQP
jgi:hypothetical protein